MVCFGPNFASGTNILIAQNIKGKSFLERLAENTFDQEETEILLEPELVQLLEEYKTTPAELFTSIKNGFSLASASGPLANEQMMGVIFILESIQAVKEPIPNPNNASSNPKPEEKKVETEAKEEEQPVEKPVE